MKILKSLEDCCNIPNPVVTLGTFDGVHKGHQSIFRKVKEVAGEKGYKSVVITFWPHPRYVLNRDADKFSLLNTLDEKIRLIEGHGIDYLLVIPFTREFSQQKPGSFIQEILIEKIGVKEIVIGYDHRFGKNREGSIEFLIKKEYADRFHVHEVEPFMMGYVNISSTKVRQALSDGHAQQANQMLGYNYSFEGRVIKGMGLGKKINFPTANIQKLDENKMLPADGIYVCSAEAEGKQYHGVLNIGNNPTIPEKGRSIEIHLFDFNEDIYGRDIRVSFFKRIRDEQKFDSIEALRDSMFADREFALQYLKNN